MGSRTVWRRRKLIKKQIVFWKSLWSVFQFFFPVHANINGKKKKKKTQQKHLTDCKELTVANWPYNEWLNWRHVGEKHKNIKKKREIQERTYHLPGVAGLALPTQSINCFDCWLRLWIETLPVYVIAISGYVINVK